MAGTLSTAQRIKLARTEAGLSQPQLAQLTGFNQAQISRWENGVQAPHASNVDTIMNAIAEYMGHAPTTLAALDGTMGIIGRTAGKLVLVGNVGTQATKPIEWLAENYVARGYVTLIGGQAGAGKSMHCHTLAAGWANGADEAAGLRLIGKQLRGLIIDAENVMVYGNEDGEFNANLLVTRLQACGINSENEDMVICAGAKGFDIEKDYASLEAAVRDMQASPETAIDYIIFDTWKTLWSGSENNPEAVTRCLNLLNALAARFNIGVVLIHHVGKSGELRGSSSIEGTVALVFTFVKVKGTDDMGEDEEDNPSSHSRVRRLHCQKSRIAAEPQDMFVFMTNHGIMAEPCECEQCQPEAE